jgi:hypothetical protein
MNYENWTMRFGKHKGQKLGDLVQTERSYLVWLEGTLDDDNKLKPAVQHLLGGTAETGIDAREVALAEQLMELRDDYNELAERVVDLEIYYKLLTTSGEVKE